MDRSTCSGEPAAAPPMQKTRTGRRPCAFHRCMISSTPASQPATPNEVRPARFTSCTSCSGAGLESFRCELRHPCRDRASGGDVAPDDAGGLAGGVALNRSRNEVRRIGFAGLDAELLQRAAVQEDLVVRLLQRNRVVGRDRIELFTRERLPVVGELCRRPAADVEDPAASANFLRPLAEHLDRLLARVDTVEAKLQLPGVARAQQVQVVVDEARDRPCDLASRRSWCRGRRALRSPGWIRRRRCDRP